MKKDVQPFIKSSTKDFIYQLSFITGNSVKQICEDLCVNSLRNRKSLIDVLLPYIRRSFKLENKTYVASSNPIKKYPIGGELKRVTIKIDLELFNFANNLAFSLGWSTAKLIAFCIERSITDMEFLNAYTTKYLKANLDESRMKTISTIMKDAEEEFDEEHSIVSFLVGMFEEYKEVDHDINITLKYVADKW